MVAPVVAAPRAVLGSRISVRSSSSSNRNNRSSRSAAVRPRGRCTVRVSASGVAHEGGSVDPDTISALNNRILIRPDQIEEKTAGGILLPGSATTVGGTFGIGEVRSEDCARGLDQLANSVTCIPTNFTA